jgi:FtsP/CotA-like multicopper oxidase with cupredoxin domain
MMTQRHGFLGDRMLVNGRERPSLSLATRAYRLRLLNGSSSRVYRLVWSDETPMTVIGSDGGLLERPVVRRSLTLAPAQRADVIVDLSNRPLGAALELRSAPFPAGEIDPAGGGGMGRGMVGSGAVPQGAPLALLTLKVERREASAFRLPPRLSTFNAAWRAPADGPWRRIELSFAAGQWLLGGRTFQMMDVADDEVVRAGASQIWEVANVGGMMGSPMAHPLHMHGPQFRVLSRTRPAGETPPSVAEGLLDDGWTDTVLVLPRETVRLHVHFTRHPGLYLDHCHILDHEDLGMMRNFRVVPA